MPAPDSEPDEDAPALRRMVLAALGAASVVAVAVALHAAVLVITLRNVL